MKTRPDLPAGSGRRGVALVSPGVQQAAADLPARAAGLAAAGLTLVQIREKEMPAGDLVSLARAVLAAVAATPCRVVINGRLDVALAVNAHGVHLPGNGLPAAQVRRLAGSGMVVGVSAHTPEEVSAAARAGADYVFYGPAFPTESHPGVPGIGRRGLAEALQAATLPVWAIGGIRRETVGELAGLPLAGVACMRALLGPGDPAALLAALAPGSTSPV